MSEQERRKVAAGCVSCGSVYASYQWSDGTILPIGQKEGCECGSAEFQPIDGEDDTTTPRAEQPEKVRDD